MCEVSFKVFFNPDYRKKDLEYAFKICSRTSTLCTENKIGLHTNDLLLALSSLFFRMEIDSENILHFSDEMLHYLCHFIEEIISQLAYKYDIFQLVCIHF